MTLFERRYDNRNLGGELGGLLGEQASLDEEAGPGLLIKRGKT
jgi:hypothetical protein